MRFLITHDAAGHFDVSSPDLPGWSAHEVPTAHLARAVMAGHRAHERRQEVGATNTPESWATATPQPAPDPEAGEVQQLPISRLFADPTYQRPLDERRVARMAAEFDQALIGVLEVSARPDGTFAIVDGQHRWALLRDLADEHSDPHVPCRIHHDLSPDDEAALFFDIDASRRRLTGWDRWQARRGADDPVVVEIEQTLARLGLRTGPIALAGEPVLRSTGAAEQIHTLGGPGLLHTALSIILDAWGPDPDALTAGILGAVATLLTCYRYPDELSTSRLVHALQGLTPRQVAARATGKRETTKGTTPRLTAMVLLDAYNTGLRGKERLDPTEIRRDAMKRPGGIGQTAPLKTRPCAQCGEPISKKPGPGRWPTYCPACRDQRRAAKTTHPTAASA